VGFNLCKSFQKTKIDLISFSRNNNYQIKLECKNDNIKIEKNNISYEFEIEDNKLKSVIVSDKRINNYFAGQLRNNNIINEKILEFVKSAIIYEIIEKKEIVNTEEIEEINKVLSQYDAYL
jgi:hypothetical protein